LIERRFNNFKLLEQKLINLLLIIPQRIKMAKHMILVVSLGAIACTLAIAFEPGPLHDFCVADPTRPGLGPY